MGVDLGDLAESYPNISPNDLYRLLSRRYPPVNSNRPVLR